jgi:hypothetical protein
MYTGRTKYIGGPHMNHGLSTLGPHGCIKGEFIEPR